MTAAAFKDACHSFAQVATPYLHIKDEHHYEEALELIEGFLEEAEDSFGDPLNDVIELLSRAIEAYENKDVELAAFSKRSLDQPADLATLRILIDQYNLGIADLPEIGSKSMVSRVLSGERNLNKKHIKALSDRFQISPDLFF
ncbi:MAG: transcriptional regulator [Sedimenticola sp.]